MHAGGAAPGEGPLRELFTCGRDHRPPSSSSSSSFFTRRAGAALAAEITSGAGAAEQRTCRCCCCPARSVPLAADPRDRLGRGAGWARRGAPFAWRTGPSFPYLHPRPLAGSSALPVFSAGSLSPLRGAVRRSAAQAAGRGGLPGARAPRRPCGVAPSGGGRPSGALGRAGGGRGRPAAGSASALVRV